MEQTVIQIGNSAGIIIPKNTMQELGIKAGDKINLQKTDDALVISKKPLVAKPQPALTPEFAEWLNKFNAKYKNALTELAKK